MQNLRDNDGTPIHRRAIRFHAAKCRTGTAPLHAQLRTEATALYNDLKTKERAREDAEDNLVEATAEAEAAEVAFENAIRDLDSDLERLDRDNPGTNARIAIFPNGFGAVIEPEGGRQLEILPALHARIEPFKNQPALGDALKKLASTEQTLRDALSTEEAASETVESIFAVEVAIRASIRAQLTSAHGRLRDLYKSRPALAEAFFMKLGRKEGKPKAKTPTPANPTPVEAAEPKGSGDATGGADKPPES